MTDTSRAAFPWWVPLGGVVLALGHLPAVVGPPDFAADGASNWAVRLALTAGVAAGLLVAMRMLGANPSAALAAGAAAVWLGFADPTADGFPWAGVGILAVGVVLNRTGWARTPVPTGATLWAVGAITSPALFAWGGAVLLAAVLTVLPPGRPKRVVWAGVGVGLAGLMVVTVGLRERAAARSRVLWAALEHIEQTAPPNARVAWAGLSPEDGERFRQVLAARGRGDVVVCDEPVAGPEFAATYWFGRGRVACRVAVVRPDTPFRFDPWVAAYITAGFEKP